MICFAEKIEYSARLKHHSSPKTNLCLGTIVRVDSELVFQVKENGMLITISYNKDNRPPVSDYVSNQPVVPSEVTPGQTELYFSDIRGCLSKGAVTFYNPEFKMYKIDGHMKRGVDVRYSKGHGEA